MAQPETAAGGEAVQTGNSQAIDPIDALVDEMLPDPEEEQEEAPEGEATASAAEEQEDEAGNEADLPPIGPPVSWSAEEKAKFAELPRDVQETLNRRETEREKFVQSKATEAARARQEAERVALEQVAEIERQAVEQLQRFSAALSPQRPDPRLLQGDDTSRAYFYQLQAEYEAVVAQQGELQRAAAERGQRAQNVQQELQRREVAGNVQILQDQFPEYLDPAKTELRNNLASTASALGYSPEQIAQARAPDILAMRTASEWKAKADKWDAANKTKMAVVRDAKNLPPVARPGAAQPRGQASKAAMDQSFNRFRESRNYGDAADFLHKAGWL